MSNSTVRADETGKISLTPPNNTTSVKDEVYTIVYKGETHRFAGSYETSGNNECGNYGVRSETYYGEAFATEYNPQVWVGYPTWYAVKNYVTGSNAPKVFNGWSVVAKDGSVINGIYPGEVFQFKDDDADPAKHGWYLDTKLIASENETIHVYATWANLTQTATNTGSISTSTGTPFTNIRIITSNQDASASILNNCTVRCKDNANYTLTFSNSSEIVLSKDCIIDTIGIKGYGGSHSDTGKGLYANGNILVMGEGIKSISSATTPSATSFLQIYGGGNSSNVTNSKLIVHSGIYSNISGAGGTSAVTGTATTILKGATVLDSIYGASGGTSHSNVTGTANLYLIGVKAVGDYYSERQLGNEKIYDGNGTEIKIDESVAICGGGRYGPVNNANVYVTGNAYVWEIQGGDRDKPNTSGTNIVCNVNISISGKAVIAHLACGTVTDANNAADASAANNVHIKVTDDPHIAMLLGAGYDTWGSPTKTSMLGGTISMDIAGGEIGYVYGGGFRGTVGATGNNVDISINVSGGEIKEVFGGGRGGFDKIKHSSTGGVAGKSDAGYKDTTGESKVVGNTSITVTGGTIENVYGGGESIPMLKSYYGTSFSASNKSDVATIEGNTTVRIQGGTITGSVYGGGKGIDPDTLTYYSLVYLCNADGEFSSQKWFAGTGTLEYYLSGSTDYYSNYYQNYARVTGNSTVEVTGGTIGGNVYGGGAYGKVVGKATVTTSNCTIGSAGCSDSEGNVYGGGKGMSDRNYVGSVGSVNAMNVSGTVYGNVYGGGAYGNITSGGTDVTISGIVHKNVYGGGFGKDTSTAADQSKYGYIPQNASVTVNGTVKGNVFGGGAMGQVGGQVSITFGNNAVVGIEGDSRNGLPVADGGIGNVFGGGQGSDVNAGTGKVGSVASLEIKGDVYGNVYGGGAFGNVGTGNTNVTITGTVHKSVYGGGFGKEANTDQFGYIPGTATVTVNNAVYGNVYGGGALGQVGGQVSIVFGNSAVIGVEGCSDEVGNVYGGGQGSSTVTGTGKVGSVAAMNVKGTVYGNVYGGGAYGNVSTGSTSITIIGTVHKSVYGGGFGKEADTTQFGYIPGNATVTVNNAVYGNVYGGGAMGQVNGTVTIVFGNSAVIGYSGCPDTAGNVYGGGQGSSTVAGTGKVGSVAAMNVKGTVYGNVYGGGAYGNVDSGSTSITITGTVHKSVYGGGFGKEADTTQFGYIPGNATVTVNNAVYGNVYGGGALGQVGGEVSIVFGNSAVIGTSGCSDSVGNVYGGGQGSSTVAGTGKVGSVAPMDVKGTVYGNVYGGGAYGNVSTGGTVITVTTDGTVYKSVYGGGFGKMKNTTQYGYIPGNTSIFANGTIRGNVYGGGAFGQVGGSTSVEINTNIGYNGCPDSLGNVYGGGQGSESSPTIGKVAGNTEVIVNDGFKVWNNVYGGGAYGPVGGSTQVTIDGDVLNVYGAGKGTSSNSSVGSVQSVESVTIVGNVRGNVYGGGAYGSVLGGTGYEVLIKSGATVSGSVYGGGQGTDNHADFGKVSTDVSVVLQVSSTVSGNVYGGGAYGQVVGNIDVSVSTDIGVEGCSDEFGNVYGGGQGVSTSTDIGMVTGDITVTIANGKTVWNNVYGGGAYGSVTGSTTVVMNGTATEAYGAGKGVDTNNNIGSVGSGSSLTVAGHILENVYGGGAYGIVRNGTTLVLTGATVDGNVYGGGLGKSGIESVTGTVTLRMTDTTVAGNVFGGSAYGIVTGNIVLDLSGGTIEGTVYGGGLGVANYKSVTGTRKIYVHGNAVVNGSIYGGSSLGTDGDAGTMDSDSVIFLQSVALKGSVFGGGFMGSTYGSAKIFVGVGSLGCADHGRENLFAGIYDSNDSSNTIDIAESLYLGGDVGNVAASAAFRIAMVQNGGSMCICGTGAEISILGSIMGSGNSCYTLGQTSIHLKEMNGENTLNMESIHRVTQLILENSVISFNGRATVNESGSPLIMNSMYGLYKIGFQTSIVSGNIVDSPVVDSTPSFTPGLILRNGTTLTISASVDNISRYASQNGDGNDTQSSSPFNKLVLSGGNTLILRTISGSGSNYSKVFGYTALSHKGDDVGFGGYIFGSHLSDGGFMVSSGGVYVEADHYNILDGAQNVICKCWFISGVINNTITVTTENNRTIDSIVTLPSLHADTTYRYTGGIFIKSSPAQDYNLVQKVSGLEDGEFFVRFGYLAPGNDDHEFVNFANGTFLEDSFLEDERSLPASDGKPLYLNPSMNIQIQGQFKSSQYVGYVIIYISEVRAIDLGSGDPVFIVVNTIQTKINIYSSVSSALSPVNEETINIATVNKTGYTDLFLPTGHPGAVVTVEEVTTEVERPGAIKLYIQSVKNGDNSLGWTDSLGAKQFYTDGQTTVTKVGTLQGGYISSLRFTVKDFNSLDGESETYTVRLSINENGTIYYYLITINIQPEPNVLVVFNGIRTNFVDGNYNTVNLTYSFPYGSTLSKSDCPPGGTNFVGWYTDDGFVNPFSYTTPLTKKVLNLYALYMCVVTFDYMDGTTSTYNINEHTPLGNNIPNPTRQGYNFIAYYTDKDYRIQWEMSTPVDQDMTLYAKWEGKSVNVKFYYYDGNTPHEVEYLGEPLNYDIVFGDSFKVDNTPEQTMIQLAQDCMRAYMKPGEKFIYWYTVADGKTYVIYDDSYLKNFGLVEEVDDKLVVKLYARTSSIAIQVTMDSTVKAGSSTNSSTIDVKANVDPPGSFLVFPEDPDASPYVFNVKLNGASRPGFELTGWKLDKVKIGATEYTVTVTQDGSEALFKAGSNIEVIVTEEGGRYYVTFNGIDVMQGGSRFSMDEAGFKTPVEFIFTSEWEYLEFTVTIAPSTAGTITAYGSDLVPFTEKTFHYNESISLRYDAVGGYVFYRWNTNGEGSFQNASETETTYVVLGDATISVLVYGPQFMEIIVDYLSVADLTSDTSKIPTLQLLDKETGEPVTKYPFSSTVVKVDGKYRVTYTGIADIGVYGTAIIGPTTGKLYNLDLDAVASTSVITVQRPYPVTMIEDRLTAAAGVVKTEGISVLSEFLLNAGDDVVLTLNPGFTYTAAGSPQGVERNFTGSGYNYVIDSPSGAIAVVGQIGKMDVRVDLSFSASEAVPGKTIYIPYGTAYLEELMNNVPDGYQLLFWYFGNNESNRVTNMSLCEVDDGSTVYITGKLVKVDSLTSVDLVVDIEDMFPVSINGVRVLEGYVKYQFDLRDGYVFGTTVSTNLGDRELACSEDGFLSLQYEPGMTTVTVHQNRMTISIGIVIDGNVQTPVTNLKEGSFIDLDAILDAYRTAHSIVGRPYGTWILDGLNGSVVDQRYTVVLEDILAVGDKTLSVESIKPEVTLIAPAGTAITQWNGSAYVEVGTMVKITVPYPDAPGSRTAWYDDVSKVLHVNSLEGEKLFKLDLKIHATHYTIDDDGWSNLDGSGELRTLEDVTLIAIVNKNTYSVRITADSNVKTLSVAYGEDSYEVIDGVVSGIPYNTSVRITVIFKDRYTINLNALDASEPGSSYTYDGTTSPLSSKTTVEKKSSLQDYSIRFFIEGDTEIDLTSSYCGLTAYFVVYGTDNNVLLTFSFADPSMVIGSQFKKNVTEINDRLQAALLAAGVELDDDQFVKMWYKEPGLKTLWSATSEGGERYFVIDDMRSNQNFYAKIETLVIPDLDEIYSGNPYYIDVSGLPSVAGNVSYTIRMDEGEYSSTIPSFTDIVSESHDFYVKLNTYGIIQDITVLGVNINISPATVMVVPKNYTFSIDEVKADGFNIENYHNYTVLGLNPGYSVLVISYNYENFEPELGSYNYTISFKVMNGATEDTRVQAPTINGIITVTKTGYASVTVGSAPSS